MPLFPSSSLRLRAVQHALLAALACLLSGLTQAQLIPTRFSLCSNEAAALKGAARHNEMRQCLSRRYYAEKLIRKDCRKQVRAMVPPPKDSDARFKLERQCYINSLQPSYKTLPQVPVAPPKPKPVAKPGAPAGAAPAAKVAKPAPAPAPAAE